MARFSQTIDDLLLLQTLTTQHWHEIEDDETFDRLRLAATVLVIGSNEDHAWAVKNRRPHRQYLSRAALLPDPHANTPWTRLIKTCFQLHNLRTRLVGINQIKNIYVPVWREGSGERVWEGFEDILFSDQRKHDRVHWFHVQEEWYRSHHVFLYSNLTKFTTAIFAD